MIYIPLIIFTLVNMMWSVNLKTVNKPLHNLNGKKP